MATSGIFFIPPNPSLSPAELPVNKLTATLKRQYNLEQLPRWGLEHRLFRQTPPPSSSTSPSGTSDGGVSYMQVLNLSYLPGNAYVGITKTHSSPSASSSGGVGGGDTVVSEPATIIALPSQSSGDFSQLITSRLGALWTGRSMVSVNNALAFSVGDFTVRYGEVKQGSGAGQVARGTVVVIEWDVGDEGEGEVNWEVAESVIRVFWRDLGIEGARRVVRVKGVEGEGSGKGDRGMVGVRQWFEVLRMRA